jgi:hypothetical protein
LSSLRKVPIQNSVPLATVSAPDPTHRSGMCDGQPLREVKGLRADRDALLDLLSEILAADRATEQAYRTIIVRTRDEAISGPLQEFLDQNQRQLDLIENVIRRVGGDPARPGPGGLIAAARLDRMIEPSPQLRSDDHEAVLLADLQTLVLLETERRDNWLFLEELAPVLEDETATGLIAGRIGDLNIEQELHAEWILGALNTLRMRRLRLTEPSPGTWHEASRAARKVR